MTVKRTPLHPSLSLVFQLVRFKHFFLLFTLLALLPATYAQTQLGLDIDGEAAGDRSGYSVSLSADGSRMAIGAIGNSNGAGHVRVYDWNGTAWVQVGSDIDGEAADDNSGWSISLSADGSRLAIGARYNDGNGFRAGHVRVYDWNGTAWVQAGSDIDGEAADDNSGLSVSLSADGSRLAIGAPFNAGAGYVQVYDWNGSAWVQAGSDIDGEAADDNSGRSVSLSADGSRLAIGAPANDGNGFRAGHVRVYDWNGSAWVQAGSDIDSEAALDEFGYSVSLSADGSRLAIGAPANGGNGLLAGHVRVYDWNGSAWVQAGSDIDGEAVGDWFGSSVSLSADGSRLAIGAIAIGTGGINTSAGHVRVYDWNGTAWVQAGSDIDGDAADDNFGYSVSLSADGNRLAIGARFNAGNSSLAGHVRVYTLCFCDQPSAYSGEDIGDVSGNAGSTTESAGVYTLQTSGTGIKGINDGFHFAADPSNGDTDLIVRVTGIQNNASRQAGLMLRECLGPDAPNVALVVNGQKQVKMTRRDTEGGTTITVATKAARRRLNSWLRLTLTGKTVIGYYSRNGTVWEYVGTANLDVAPCDGAGLVASKGATGATKTFTFDNFTVNGVVPNAGPPRLAQASDAMNHVAIVAYPNPFGDELSYRLEGVEGDATVRLLDMAGRVITTVEPLESNVSTAVINTAKIAAGIYFLEVRTATERQLVKVVKR